MERKAEYTKERGFTLTELMIVTALLGLVLSGMYNMFVHQQKSYSVQDDVSIMQQNVRVGLSYLVKDIRMAGYIPEDIPFDPVNPPVPTPSTTEPSTDVSGQPFTDGDAEPIEEATATAITLQADIDNDAITETVRYALNGTDLTMEVWEWNGAMGGQLRTLKLLRKTLKISPSPMPSCPMTTITIMMWMMTVMMASMNGGS